MLKGIKETCSGVQDCLASVVELLWKAVGGEGSLGVLGTWSPPGVLLGRRK